MGRDAQEGNNLTIWFTSDTHFWHKNIIKYTDRPFDDVEAMNQALIDNWNASVGPKDDIYHLGDFGFASPAKLVPILRQLNGRKHLIVGNHDRGLLRNEEFRTGWEWIRDYYELKVQDHTVPRGTQLIVLCHFALLVWNLGHHGAWMGHGHSHGTLDNINATTKRHDLGVDSNNYSPLSYVELKAIMADRVYTPLDCHTEGTN